MNTAALIAAVRVRMDDTALPTLLSDQTIMDQASLTQTEFARATLVLFDVTTAAITLGNAWLTLPTNFCVLKAAILSGVQLRPITTHELDYGYFTLTTTENTGRFSNWRAATGTPKFVVVDEYPDRVRLVPTPIANGTATVEGYVVPADITALVPPAIPAMYHELLVAGTLVRLYSLFDVENDACAASVLCCRWCSAAVHGYPDKSKNAGDIMIRKAISVFFLGIAALGFASSAALADAAKPGVILQVSDDNPKTWGQALNVVKNIQNAYGKDKVDIEVVAFGLGAGMLKMDSPLANRIDETLATGANVAMCENTMKGQKLTRDDMHPRIAYVPAGVIEIIEKQKQGWTVIRP